MAFALGPRGAGDRLVNRVDLATWRCADTMPYRYLGHWSVLCTHCPRRVVNPRSSGWRARAPALAGQLGQLARADNQTSLRRP
jgi:hypothetical protein